MASFNMPCIMILKQGLLEKHAIKKENRILFVKSKYYLLGSKKNIFKHIFIINKELNLNLTYKNLQFKSNQQRNE